MKPFNCTSCGACCKSVSDDVLAIVGLPKHDKQSGCGNLNDDLTCKIYETRPLICRVDGMFENYYSKVGWTWEEFCAENEKSCEQLQQKEIQKDE